MTEQDFAAQGWTRLETRAFSQVIGPIWARPGAAGIHEIALVCTDAIVNDHARSVHGGALMTFADIALGYTAAAVSQSTAISTAQLQYHFAAAVRAGDLLVCEGEVIRTTRRAVFVRGLFRVGEERVGMADAMFNLFAPKTQAGS